MEKFFIGFIIGIMGLSLIAYNIIKEEQKKIQTIIIEAEKERKINQKEIELFLYANSERNKKLEINQCLTKVARKKSKTLYEENYFSHKDPKTDKILTWDWITEKCFEYKYAGENLTKGYIDSIILHKALMNSQAHKDNIIDKNYDLMGVGCFEDICTELFAKKLQ